jgi:hypothetical protein
MRTKAIGDSECEDLHRQRDRLGTGDSAEDPNHVAAVRDDSSARNDHAANLSNGSYRHSGRQAPLSLTFPVLNPPTKWSL